MKLVQLYDKCSFNGILLEPPVADCRNMVNSALYVFCKDFWINYFFSRELSGVEDIKQQVKATKSSFSIFSRSTSTIFFEFSYDKLSKI